MTCKWLSELLELLYEPELSLSLLQEGQTFSPKLEESFENKVSYKVPSTELDWVRLLRQSIITMSRKGE